MRVLADVLTSLTWLYIGLLILRMIMSYVFMFARDFRPSGAFAMILEVCYSLTDPPLRLLRRWIPPLRIGNASIDLSFIVLFVFCYALLSAWAALGS